MTVPSRYLVHIFCRRFEVIRDWHVKDDFEHLDPRGKGIIFSQKWANKELICSVENLDDLMENGKSHFVLSEILHVALDDWTNDRAHLCHYFN